MGRSMIALLLGAPLVALVVNWAAGPGPFGLNLWIVASVGLAAAVLIGMPLLFLALDRGRDGLTALIVLGSVGGALAPLLLLLSGIVGVFLHSGADYLRFTLAHGASIPAYGQLAWPKFLGLVARAVTVGAVTGALCAIARRLPSRG
jgi:hypothetical protein